MDHCRLNFLLFQTTISLWHVEDMSEFSPFSRKYPPPWVQECYFLFCSRTALHNLIVSLQSPPALDRIAHTPILGWTLRMWRMDFWKLQHLHSFSPEKFHNVYKQSKFWSRNLWIFTVSGMTWERSIGGWFFASCQQFWSGPGSRALSWSSPHQLLKICSLIFK